MMEEITKIKYGDHALILYSDLTISQPKRKLSIWLTWVYTNHVNWHSLALIASYCLIYNMQSNLLSVKAIRSYKSGKVNSDTGDVSDSAMHSKNKIIHEHEFVTVRIK